MAGACFFVERVAVEERIVDKDAHLQQGNEGKGSTHDDDDRPHAD